MAILSAKRYNKPIKTFYQRLIASGKPPKVAITACMRKLLVTLNSMVKNQTDWQPDFADFA
jgi:transposase